MKKNYKEFFQDILTTFLSSGCDRESSTTNLRVISIEDATNIVNEFIKISTGKPLLDAYITENKICVVGDIRGQITTLRILLENDKYFSSNYVFLGNYIGEGPKSLYCLLMVYLLKIINPHNVVIRGCNETEFGMRTLFNDILFHYADTSDFAGAIEDDIAYQKCEKFAQLVEHSFDYMSYCAVVNNRYFMSHAGLSEDANFTFILAQLTKPFSLKLNSNFYAPPAGLEKADRMNAIALELLWNRYSNDDVRFNAILNHGCYKTYNDVAIADFLGACLKEKKLYVVIHGHEDVDGYEVNDPKTSITLNSNTKDGKHRSVLFIMKNAEKVEQIFVKVLS